MIRAVLCDRGFKLPTGAGRQIAGRIDYRIDLCAGSVEDVEFHIDGSEAAVAGVDHFANDGISIISDP